MSEYLLARAADEKQHLASRAGYRRKYFTDDCFFDSRKFTLEMIESEKVVDIEQSVQEAKVITTYSVHIKGTTLTNRQRYHLKPLEESWLIEKAEMACLNCKGRDNDCVICKGKRWIHIIP
ncbi:MAG: hypothetical protein ACI8QI_000586 [Limisphaerales bacterium]|jgi:hypothetical protein